MPVRHSARSGIARCLGLTLSFAALLILSSVGAKPEKAEREDPSRWPLTQWITWRDQQISHILEPSLDWGGERLLKRKEMLKRCLEAYDVVAPCLQNDPHYFTADPDRAQALGNFIRFIKAQHWMALVANPATRDPYGLGLEVSDEQYWTLAAPYLGFPDLLKSQAFLTRMARPETYREALAMIAQHNATLPAKRQWIPLLFKGQFITTVDAARTFGRLLVVIPNEPFGASGIVDRWVSFGIATPDRNPVPEMQSVSMLTLYRSASTPDKTKTYFSDFMRIRDPQTGLFTIKSNFLLPDNPSHNCYNCHKPSVIPIHPGVEYDFDARGELVEKTGGIGVIPEKLNRFVRGYGPPDFIYQDTEAYGPCIGPANKIRTDAFIRSATIGLNLSPSSYDTIRNAMQCSSCHHRFSSINYPQAVRTDLDINGFPVSKTGMVQTYIERGYMPPGVILSPEERQGLWRCLIKEYCDLSTQQGLFVEWLKGGNSDPMLQSTASR